MEPTEQFVDALREQVRRLQALVRDLKGHPQLAASEYLYGQMTLQDVIKHLKQLEQLSSLRGADVGVCTRWLN